MNPGKLNTAELYSMQVAKTDTVDKAVLTGRCALNADLIHYALGLGTEAAEVQDLVKKHIAYGRELPKARLLDELGDLLWYITRMLSVTGYTLEEAMGANLAKLRARYPEGFTETAAVNRNTEVENRAIGEAVRELCEFDKSDPMQLPRSKAELNITDQLYVNVHGYPAGVSMR